MLLQRTPNPKHFSKNGVSATSYFAVLCLNHCVDFVCWLCTFSMYWFSLSAVIRVVTCNSVIRDVLWSVLCFLVKFQKLLSAPLVVSVTSIEDANAHLTRLLLF